MHRLFGPASQEQRDGNEASKAKLLPGRGASQAKQQPQPNGDSRQARPPPFRRQAQLLPRVMDMMGSFFSAICAPLWFARLLAKLVACECATFGA